MKIITNWIKKNKTLENIKIIIILSVFFFFLLEGISSIAYYHKSKASVQSVSSTVAAMQWFIHRLQPVFKDRKFNRVIKLREQGINAYPTYIFNPSLHNVKDFYHLSNVPQSYVVYCQENSGIAEWNTDELGFRNPKGQLGSSVDFLFIGDSFAEGACQPEEYTFAGVFRGNGEKVFNLGRGGSGPLFQLATLVEYEQAVKANTVLWIIFTGNDLKDLRSEKTSKLSRYLIDDYSQSLLLKKDAVEQNLTKFLERKITFKKNKLLTDDEFLSSNTEAILNISEAKIIESPLLLEVASMIKKKANRSGSELAIAIINHPRYRNVEIQDITSAAIKQFSFENEVPFIEFSRDYLTKNWKKFYINGGPHFNSEGYLTIGKEMYSWINSNELQNKIVTDKN